MLNYECINGHKWKSKSWPVAEFYSRLSKQHITLCPICKTDILRCSSSDLKQGAIHTAFGEKLK